MRLCKARACALSLAAAGVAVLLHAMAAGAATINDNPSGTCIAIDAPIFKSWEPKGTGREYKFSATYAPYTPACAFGCLCSSSVMFGLTVEGTGTWDGQGKAVEHLRFIINWHPISLYNGDWFAQFTLACPKDPWLNNVTCKLTNFTRSLPGAPSDPQLYTAFGFSAPYPKTKISSGEQQAIRTMILVKATVSAIEQSITIKKPTSGALIPSGAPLEVVITNPFGTTVNLFFSQKVGSWAGSGAFTMTTKGTSVIVPSSKFPSIGFWTVRAWPAGMPGTPGTIQEPGPRVDFIVGGVPF
jgi:hypothetical protein